MIDIDYERTAITDLTQSHSDIFLEFKEDLVDPLFGEILAGYSSPRRPSLALRLPCKGEPRATLVVRPLWDRGRKRVLPGIKVEIQWDDRDGEPHTYHAVDVEEGKVRLTCWSTRDAERNFGRMTEVIEEFLDEPTRVLGRSKDRCCICGRKLTDMVSKARGIGPECATKIRLFVGLRRNARRGLVGSITERHNHGDGNRN